MHISLGLYTSELFHTSVDCTGTHLHRHSGHVCFQPTDKSELSGGITWYEARETCKGNQQIMAMVTHEEYQAHIQEVVATERYDDLWIGAKEGFDWVWSCESPSDS